MNINSQLFNKIIYLLLIGLMTYNCAGDMEAVPSAPPPISPVGEYMVIEQMNWIVGTSTIPYPDIDCDLLGAFKFKSNNEIEFKNYNLNNDNDCDNSEIITGDWISGGSTPGGFSGDLSFDSTFQGQNIYNASYSSNGNSNDGRQKFNFYFTIVVDDQEIRYVFDFVKL
ncbi:hypothetical protein [uncultured Winogradskyella sp.]|uniref:hypothetical protein n=1 Tax=uncultured Winogradskyella sp. TaxID=395353 RepID=UPI0026126761|nr:hypothetical protein [uncultured Winogradskyella sp.]